MAYNDVVLLLPGNLPLPFLLCPSLSQDAGVLSFKALLVVSNTVTSFVFPASLSFP